MMTFAIIFIFVLVAIFFVAAIIGIAVSSCKALNSVQQTVDRNQPRITPVIDSSVYTFKLDSELTADEWQMLFNAGWEFVTSNTEQYDDYAHWGPDAPKIHKTRWNYVFRKKS